MLNVALVTLVLASAGISAASPASAVIAPTPLPRPTTGGIKPTYCPQDGNVAIAVTTLGGKTTFKVGDTVTVLARVTAGACDVLKVTAGMHTGGGLSDTVTSGLASRLAANTTGTATIQAKALQPGTWTYTTYVQGNVFGTTSDIDPACQAYTDGTTSGWACQRNAQAPVTITITGPDSPTPAPNSGTAVSGSSGGSASQGGGGGSTQATPASDAGSAPTGGAVSVGRVNTTNPLLLIGLSLLLLLAMAGAGVVLIRRWMAHTWRPFT